MPFRPGWSAFPSDPCFSGFYHSKPAKCFLHAVFQVLLLLNSFIHLLICPFGSNSFDSLLKTHNAKFGKHKTKCTAPVPVESTVKQGRRVHKQSHHGLPLKGAIIKARAERV